MRANSIDVLKAFAIIAVVLYHSGLMTYGYLGVDVFLVIAGYLTTRSLYNKAIAPTEPVGGRRLYVNFEWSRILRLLPPLLVAGTFCMVMGYFLMLPDDYENVSQSVIATSGFGNNILAAITTKDYWDVVNDYKPLMHTWYVGLLMQFYLVYPILFLLARLDKRNPKGTLLTMVSSLAFVSLLVYFMTTNAAQRFYYLPSRFYEFAAGGIVALVYNPQSDKPFGAGFIYGCYVLLLILMMTNADVMPAPVRLVAVVGLTCVVLCSQAALENKVAGNAFLAKIGAASYSIFIWHQVLLAFYRYSITSKFTVSSYALLLIGTTILSWMSYVLIEQGKRSLYVSTATVFVALNVFAGFIYLRAGVVRDVPELYISKDDVHRGMHAEYVDKGYEYDKPFTTDKKHWYVIGNSFGRDFVNVILESPIAEQVEISYSADMNQDKSRFAAADRVFISTLGLSEEFVTEVEILCTVNGLKPEQLTIVGEKNFGESNGQIYFNRNKPDYFEQFTEVEDKEKYIEKNRRFAEEYGDRFVDLMQMVTNDKDQVRVFTPDHHFISADCRHLSKGGAIFYAERIDWDAFL